MSSKYYLHVKLNQSSVNDSNLYCPYEELSHTDGSYYDRDIDFVVMNKVKSENIQGGELSLLHSHDINFDDIEEKCCSKSFTLWLAHQKTTQKSVEKSLFYFDTKHRCFRFTDQMILPKNMSEAKFLHTVADKLENSPSRYDYDHNEGELFIVNNKFWVHGRRKILSKTDFNRELLRIRGHFC